MDFPGHDELGDAFLSVDGDAMSDLTLVAQEEGALEFQLVSFGDNDYGDCEHSGFQFWVEIDLGVR